MRRKWPGLWRSGWILYQDNAPSRNVASVKQFLFTTNITLHAYPCYSPDLAPCTFFLIPEIKIHTQRNPFFVSRGAKQKRWSSCNCSTENGESYMKKSLWSQERKMEMVKNMKPEIICDMQGMGRADEMLYHYPCCK